MVQSAQWDWIPFPPIHLQTTLFSLFNSLRPTLSTSKMDDPLHTPRLSNGGSPLAQLAPIHDSPNSKRLHALRVRARQLDEHARGGLAGRSVQDWCQRRY